jgi:hypothetical protein
LKDARATTSVEGVSSAACQADSGTNVGRAQGRTERPVPEDDAGGPHGDDESPLSICAVVRPLFSPCPFDLFDQRTFADRPSRRQYISQFEKWGLQKYNKGRGSAVKAENYTAFTDCPSTPKEAEGIKTVELSQSSAAPLCRREMKRTDRPEVPPKKRQKLLNFIQEMEEAKIASALDQTTSTTQSCRQPFSVDHDYTAANLNFPLQNHGLDVDVAVISPYSTAENDTDFDTPGHVSARNNPSCRPKTPNHGLDVDVAVVSPYSTAENDTDFDTPGHVSARNNPFCDPKAPNKVELDVTNASNMQDQDSLSEVFQNAMRVDFSRPVDSFNTDEIEDMNLAADFLFSCQCHADSFALYVLLLKRQKETRDLPGWMAASAFIGCVRSCMSASQFEIALNLLEQKISERPVCAEYDAHTFLYRSLLRDLHRKRGKEDEAQFQHRLAMASNFVQQKSFMPLSKEDRPLSIEVYHYLNQALASKAHFIAAHKLKDQLMSLRPGPFEYDGNSICNGSIRSCLAWCICKLQRRSPFTKFILDFKEGMNTRHAKYLTLYGDLFDRWVGERSWNTETILWASQAKQTMNISPGKLLAIVCLMILDHLPLGTAVNLRVHVDPIYGITNLNQLFSQALGGANVLSTCSDWELASAFLNAYSLIHTAFLAQSKSEELAYKSLVRPRVKSLLEFWLLLQLPDVPEVDPHRFDTPVHYRADDSTTSWSFAAICSTLAPSLQSSEFSSFRALRDRLQADIGSQVRDMSVVPPSNVIRDISRSTLSLLPINVMTHRSQSSLSLPLLENVGASALETLATVSSCVRDKVAELEGMVRGPAMQQRP